jgi:hypothetical protein
MQAIYKPFSLPMTLEEIQLVEQKLAIKLPDTYTHIQVNYPKELIELNFNQEYFISDARYLIQINEMFRTGGLPNTYLVIGHDIGGNHFFIDLRDSDFLVYYLDHEEVSEPEEGAEPTWQEVLDVNLDLIAEGIDAFGQWLIRHWGRG